MIILHKIGLRSVEPAPLTATSPKRSLFLVPAEDPYIHSYFNLSTALHNGNGQ